MAEPPQAHKWGPRSQGGGGRVVRTDPPGTLGKRGRRGGMGGRVVSGRYDLEDAAADASAEG